MDKDAVKNEFQEKIGRLTQSRAYLEFCEEVYGVRAYLFNMMDREQIDYMLNSLPITPEDTVLDLGCGTGSLLGLLAAKHGCAGVGIDMLDCFPAEHSDRIRFLCGDIDSFSELVASPTVTLSVDSLYFSRVPDKLVRDLANIKNNRLYLFWSQYLFDAAEDRKLLQSDNTRLAQALKKAGLSFRTVDFSGNERQLYTDMEKVLKKLKPAFDAEGNADLYAQKLQEVRLGTELFGKGRAARYLYIAAAESVRRKPVTPLQK